MTKYILLGGYAKKAADGGKAFCEELVRGFEQPVRILDCMFAASEDTWSERFAGDKEMFAKHLPGVELDFKLATVSEFFEQVKWANAIFLRGGEPSDLMSGLNQSPGWEKELEGKTLAGTSAGAEAISTYYHELSMGKIGHGLGLLPVKVVPHWLSDYNAPNVDWDKAYAELKEYKEDLEMLALAEGEFKVITTGG